MQKHLAKFRQAQTDPSIIEGYDLPHRGGNFALRKTEDGLFEVTLTLGDVAEVIFLHASKRRAINFMMDAHSGACRVLHIQHDAKVAADAAYWAAQHRSHAAQSLQSAQPLHQHR